MNPDERAVDRETLTRLWLEARPAVEAFVFASIRGFQDAEDVVQQVALAAARRFDEYDPTRPFVGWVLWLAKSRIVDHYRSRGRSRVVLSEAVLDRLAEILAERAGVVSRQAVALEKCLERLPAAARRLIDMRYAEDASMDAIAAAIESTAAAVRVRLHRIRTLLAECIRAELAKEAT
jgi:RNA polymerase sigma-70 factor (ECF subfamily)